MSTCPICHNGDCPVPPGEPVSPEGELSRLRAENAALRAEIGDAAVLRFLAVGELEERVKGLEAENESLKANLIMIGKLCVKIFEYIPAPLAEWARSQVKEA